MFTFKQFTIDDTHCDMKVGTDGVLLGAWTDLRGVMKVLDAGTGSGLIALMVAQRNPDAYIDAIEISPEACSDATVNIAASPWTERITLINADISAITLKPGIYDLIISNPPFFTETLHSPVKGRAASRHEDNFGVEWLISSAKRLLAPAGSVAFIAPASRDGEIEYLIELHRLHVMQRCLVFPVCGKPHKRTMWQLSPTPSDRPVVSRLEIRNPDSTLSSQYITLTSEFYL